ncbi:MAG TPA: PaaI family thioesterase [Streptosporangiaceae bacterium]|nr:PaaI family thioesterase [Streptosporangiaceae bacterium]
MTGARTAMQRAFAEDDRHRLDEDQVVVLGELAARVRELIEAAVLTDIELDEVEAVTAEVATLTQRLRAARRAEPPVADIDGHGMVRQLASPVIGKLNPIAPPIDIEALPDGTARTSYTLSTVYEGPPGYVHGGVSAMVLDHLLGCAAMLNGTPGMTASLSLSYRRPTPHGVPLVAEAKVVRVEGRKTYVDGRILDPDGRTTVEASAMFIMPRR